MSDKQSAQKNDIAQLIQLGREQGYLTHADITDTLPDGSTDEDNFEEITQVLRDMGIKVFEDTPDQDELMLGEDEETDELAAEDAVAALSQTEIESGRTTDPVRMYMREMGSVDLLTKTGEIGIAKRIEAAMKEVLALCAEYPLCIEYILDFFNRIKLGEKKTQDLISGFMLEEPEEEIIEQDFEANEELGIGAPTAVFYPAKQIKATDQSITFESHIVFKEDSTEEFSGIHLQMNYPPNLLNLDTVFAGAFLTDSNQSVPLFNYMHNVGSIDIYALGLILYEILVGEVPGRRSPMPSEVIQGLPAPIDELFDMMTQDMVSKRPANMQEVLNLLNRIEPFDRLSQQSMMMIFHKV